MSRSSALGSADILVRRLLIGIAIVAVPVIAVAAINKTQPKQNENAALSESEAAQAKALAATMAAEIAKLPAYASAQDIEAALVFVQSQTSPTPRVLGAAIAELRANDGITRNFKVALLNLRASLSSRRLVPGTGALANGAFNTSGITSFSAPSVALGGGSSNYSR
jgi:hypothetical protein